MKKITAALTILLMASYSCTAELIPCKLILIDNSIITCLSTIPNMSTKTIKYRDSEKSELKEIPSDDLSAIVFTKDSVEINYQRLLTYQYYKNKKVNKKKSWLKVLKSGYMSLYWGYQPGLGSPSMVMWYCKKADEEIAYFISMKHIGGLVITVGSGATFEKNASVYFSDYKTLSDNISKGKYKLQEIEAIVDEYNNWILEKI